MGQAPRVRVLDAWTLGRIHRMQEVVYRVLTLVSALVVDVPILRQAQDDESGAAAPVVDAPVWEGAADARGDHPWLECGGVVAAASTRWLAARRGGHHGVLATTVVGVPDQPLQRDGGEGVAGDSAGDHCTDWERGAAAVRAAAWAGAG